MHFRRRLVPNANPDLVPMIDVVFQLVVFFMVSSTFVMTPGIALNLPEASSSEAVVLNRVVVTVVSADEVYLNRDRVAIADLGDKIAELDAATTADAAAGPAASDGADVAKSAIIEANRDVPYEIVVRVLDVMRQNGYRGIALRTLEEGRSR